MSNECIHIHSNLANSGIWSIDCEIWDMGYWGVKNLGYGILGVKNLGYGILGGKKSGIWDMGTPVSPPPFMYEHFVVRYIITQMADNNVEINSGNKNKDFYMKIYVHINIKY